MSKDEKKAAEAKAVEAEATPVEEKTEKTYSIFGRKITVEKAPKPEKVELTQEEKKARNKKILKKIGIGIVCGLGLGLGVAKTVTDLKADYPVDDEPEDDTIYQIGPGKNAKPEVVELPANSVDAEEKSSEET